MRHKGICLTIINGNLGVATEEIPMGTVSVRPISVFSMLINYPAFTAQVYYHRRPALAYGCVLSGNVSVMQEIRVPSHLPTFLGCRQANYTCAWRSTGRNQGLALVVTPDFKSDSWYDFLTRSVWIGKRSRAMPANGGEIRQSSISAAIMSWEYPKAKKKIHCHRKTQTTM